MFITAGEFQPVLQLLVHLLAHQRATEAALKKIGGFEEFQNEYRQVVKDLGKAGQLPYWLNPPLDAQPISGTELAMLLQTLLGR
jgi:hypothetical protein